MFSLRKGQVNLIEHAGLPPLPWHNRIVISAAGVLAAGWTRNDRLLLISADGYSISNPLTGEIEIRNREQDLRNYFSKDFSEFKPTELDHIVKVFGVRGGDGIHCTEDGWELRSFHPNLNTQIVGIRQSNQQLRHSEYWRNFSLISLTRLEYNSLKFGLSPGESSFCIVGSGGAEIFSRAEIKIP